MVIAVNTKYLFQAGQQDYSTFIYECFCRIAAKQSQHTFIIFTRTTLDPAYSLAENVSAVVVPETNTIALPGLLYRIKIASLLKKHKADIFLNADGFYSLFTKIPQCLVVYYPAYLFDQDFIKTNKSLLLKKLTSLFLQSARVIVTASLFSKEYIIQKYKINKDKIDVVQRGVSGVYKPVAWEEKELIKAQYADGTEYFVFYGTFGHLTLLNLLKGFSQFKKWQKSSMQLLIVITDTLNNDFKEALRLFKYKKDVKILDSLTPDMSAKVTAAAYCTLYFSEYERVGIFPLQAMRCSVPVVACNSVFMKEACADAVLYADFADSIDIAEKLMLLFKDENLRKELIDKGAKRLKVYDWENASKLLWKSLLKAAG